MDINGWFVRENTFIKGFTDYVVEVKEYNEPILEGMFISHYKRTIRVAVWRGEGYEDTKHIKEFDNFEQAFKFVEDIKRTFFEDVVKEFFND